MRIIATIEDHAITELDDLSVTYTAKAAIDGDGSGDNACNDPDFQPDTSLHHEEGSALESETEPYIAVPPAIICGVKGIVLGCKAVVKYNGLSVNAVVGDVGPHAKLGEISIACAEALQIPSSPLTGGVDSGVFYQLWPGIAAPGYQLQAS